MASDGKKVELVVSAMDEFSQTLNKLQRELKTMKGGMDEQSTAVAKAKTQHDGLGLSMTALRAAMPIAGLSLLTRELISAGVATERMRNSMQAATGSTAGLVFVREEAQRLGLDLQSATEGFIKMAASAKGTALEGKASEKVFSAMAGASTALGLSAEQVNRIMMQLSQMTSKGKVEMEDLKTVSESLPGTMNLAAKAMGVTNEQLFDMMKKGQLITDDFLPKFAAQVASTFPVTEKAADSLGAEINRLKTSFFDLKITVMENGGKTLFSAAINDLETLTNGAIKAAEALGKLNSKTPELTTKGQLGFKWGILSLLMDKQPSAETPSSMSPDAYLQDRAGVAPYKPKPKTGAGSKYWKSDFNFDDQLKQIKDWNKLTGEIDGISSLFGPQFNLDFESALAEQSALNSEGLMSKPQQEQFDRAAWAAKQAAMDQDELDRKLELEHKWAGIREVSKKSELEKEVEFMAMKSAIWDDGQAQKMVQIQSEADAWEQSWAMQTDSFEVYEQRKLQIEQWASSERIKVAQNEMQLKLGWASSGFKSMGNIAESFYTMSNKKARWAFEAAKVMKVGETVTNTASAAMGAYNAMASIPYVGPALGIAAAAAAIAAGAAQIKTINSQTPDGGGMPSDTLPGGGVYGSGTVSSPVITQPMTTGSESMGTITINIHGNIIGEDEWVENNLIPAINRAGTRNVIITH